MLFGSKRIRVNAQLSQTKCPSDVVIIYANGEHILLHGDEEIDSFIDTMEKVREYRDKIRGK